MKAGRPQAKDIPDASVLAEIDRQNAERPTYAGAIWWDVAAALPAFPAKVVRAKLASLVRRGVIDGCTCGCRGDFHVLD